MEIIEAVHFTRWPNGHVVVLEDTKPGVAPKTLAYNNEEAFRRYGKGFHGVRKGKSKRLKLKVIET